MDCAVSHVLPSPTAAPVSITNLHRAARIRVLFSGTGSVEQAIWSQFPRADVVTLDINPIWNATHVCSIEDLCCSHEQGSQECHPCMDSGDYVPPSPLTSPRSCYGNFRGACYDAILHRAEYGNEVRRARPEKCRTRHRLGGKYQILPPHSQVPTFNIAVPVAGETHCYCET